MGWVSTKAPVPAFPALAFVFFALATCMVAVSPPRFLYDEIYYHQYATDIVQKGFGLTYLRELYAPTGPLYAFVHQGLIWFTGLEIVPMRLATNVLFLSSALIVTTLLAVSRAPDASSIPALAYAMPFAGVTFGLALTEVPAMLAASLGTLALVKGLSLADEKDRGQPSAYWLFVFAGLLYAAAVWGRQNYLAIVVALPVLFFGVRGFALGPWLVVTTIFCSVAAALFVIWGGLVPVAARYASDTAAAPIAEGVIASLNVVHGFYALGYAAVLLGVLSPRVFVRKVGIVAVCVLVALTAVLFLRLRVLPSRFLFERLMGSAAMEVMGIVLGVLFAFLGLWLLASVMVQCYGVVFGRSGHADAPAKGSLLGALSALELKDRIYVFASLAWLLILASNMKILHQFNSRYVTVAAPFILITAARHFDLTNGAIVRLVCGFAASMLFLANYYEWL